MNIYFQLLILCFFFIGVACQTERTKNELDKEAEQKAEEFWKNSFTKCGDSYFAKGKERGLGDLNHLTFDYIYEIKSPLFFTKPLNNDQLTPADKLNEIEWKGTTEILASTSRDGLNNKWSEWTNLNGALSRRQTVFEVRKIQGKWEFGKENSNKFLRVDCSQITQ